MGVALYPDHGAARAELVQLAVDRLRRAKAGQRQDTDAEQFRTQAIHSLSGFSMLDALVTAVDTKDRYTRRHSEDVVSYSLMIARELGMDEPSQQNVAIAALMHDVGKIGVPDAILRKPASLSDDEMCAIKQHPQMGAAIVGAVPGLENTLDAVLHHHERFDGKGYPFGLRGPETPLIARLMAVADAFSAMTTDRPYREGLGADRAIQILQDGAGTQWDPDCVSAFVRTYRKQHRNDVKQPAKRH
jgi:HD-GYP domain-containing protein (c-di-GMP phosphodiesterase class II)